MIGQIPNRTYVFLIYVVLSLATIIAFEEVRLNEFIDYDDYDYVMENPRVRAGITRESVLWALTTRHASNWHPVTWLSHMLDCQLFGVEPGWHHLINLFFHTVNTLLLFYILQKMTGAVWRSAFVAAAFAIHPLHVESVAWVAERKDVLSGFFWMLTIAAYLRYAVRPSIARYLPVFLALSLGLMAKPMLVTLPFVLLLLDYWPLGRFQWVYRTETEELVQDESVKVRYQIASPWRLLWEKIPLFILVAVLSAITFIVQQSRGAMKWGESFPLSIRISNALVSYAGYIVKMLYPIRLAVLYPHRGHSLPVWQPIVSFLLLAVASGGIIYFARRRPYLTVGWLWYVGTLVPVIGLVQVGSQAMADRYMYLPSIGLFMMAAWGTSEITAKWHSRSIVLVMPAIAILVALLICARIQVRYWQNDFTLFGRALEVTEDNYIMHHYQGRALRRKGQYEEAIQEIRESLRLNPRYFEAYNSLGIALQAEGKFDEAVSQFHKALELNPSFHQAHNNLGIMFAKRGDLENAISHFIKVIELNPANDKAHHNLAQAFFSKGQISNAIKHYRESLQLMPDSPAALNGLSWILATSGQEEFRNGTEALGLAKQACELTDYRDPDILCTLAAAYAETGQFMEAIKTAQKAVDLYLATGDQRRAAHTAHMQQLYKRGKPYRANK